MDHRTIVSFFTCQLVWVNRYVLVGTDRYDAALCALMALQYAAGGKVAVLPELVQAPNDMPRDEGWVYHFARHAVERNGM